MDYKKIAKKYWWVIAILVMAGFGKLIETKQVPVRDWSGEATGLKARLREPSSIETLKQDYTVADSLFSEMKRLPDTVQNKYISEMMELEALTTYKEKNIINEGRRLKIKDQFSSFDGHNIYMERAVKKSMNDPDSYEHLETSYELIGDSMVVYSQFRGKNAFNAKVVGDAKALMDINGTIISFEFPYTK